MLACGNFGHVCAGVNNVFIGTVITRIGTYPLVSRKGAVEQVIT